LLWLLSVAFAHAQSLPSAKPEEVGLSSERLHRALAAVKADVDKGALPGAVLLVDSSLPSSKACAWRAACGYKGWERPSSSGR
jgi:hypothetical protein